MSAHALQFDGGASQSVTAADTGLPTGTSPLSICGWYRAPSGFTQTGVVAWWGPESSPTGGKALLCMVSGSLFFTQIGSALTDPSTSNDDAWHLGMVTFDGTTWKMFRDDPTTAVDSGNLPTAIELAGTLTIGFATAGTSHFAVDDVRIYDHALDGTERAALWNGGVGTSTGVTSGLLRHYLMDEGSGSTTADATNGYTGTLNNGPTWIGGWVPVEAPPATGNASNLVFGSGTSNLIFQGKHTVFGGGGRKTSGLTLS